MNVNYSINSFIQNRTVRIVAFVLFISAIVALTSQIQSCRYDKKRQEYEERDRAKQQEVDKLKGEINQLKTELLPLAKEKEGLQQDLEKFGTQGKEAVAKQEEAKRAYETELNSIANSDQCALCKRVCADRVELGYRPCDPDYCNGHCAR